MKAKLFTDGGARGNPGPAAYGYVLEADDGTVLDARGQAIGIATNNVAEYRALVAGLEKAAELGVDELEVVSDSELVVKQMTGVYKVKNEALQELVNEAIAPGPPHSARSLHRGPPRAQRGSRPPCERGARRARLYSESYADVAQLVEHLLAMQKVEGSSPFIRFHEKGLRIAGLAF